MALRTRRNWNIGLQSSKRRGFGNVDVTGGAFRNVLLLLTATFVQILDRDPRWFGVWYIRRRKLVTAVAISGNWLLRFPMTVETRRVISWRRLESRSLCRVANSAVVVALLCV
jgi:hypothetical protein